jgi:2-oxo-4-hydroxy-4-carboxy--5-ureidoimidazoline (OHCU) decarboxylase
MSLSVALVDFHDVMEVVLDAANDKNAAGVLDAYPQADEKLSAVEAISDESGITAIRANLDGLANLAEENKTEELPAKASDLKASYVKVYLTTSIFGS